MAEQTLHPELAPADLTRHHIRGWIADLRERRSATTANVYFSGARSFCRWLLDEGEAPVDATAGVRAPVPSEPAIPVLAEVAGLRPADVDTPGRMQIRKEQLPNHPRPAKEPQLPVD